MAGRRVGPSPSAVMVTLTDASEEFGKNYVNKVQNTVDVQCDARAVALAWCNIDNVEFRGCKGPNLVGCENKVNTRVYNCSDQQAAELAAQVMDELDLSMEDQDAVKQQARDAGLDFDDGDSFQQVIKNYVLARCAGELIGNQAVTFPRVILTDCSGTQIKGLNTLNQTARCAAGAGSELLDAAARAQAGGNGNNNGNGSPPAGPPTTTSSITTSIVIAIVVTVVIVLALLIPAGIVHARKSRVA